MITPAPTSKISPEVARGTLAFCKDATATRPAIVALDFPNTSYQLHLIPQGCISGQPGKRIQGVIQGAARRVDLVRTGGRYLEPVCGRPRRVQGTVISTNEALGTLIVDAAIPIHIRLTHPGQSPSQFTPGDMVAFDLPEWATFSQHP